MMGTERVDANSLMASFVHAGSSGHGALAKPMVPRGYSGTYLVYHLFQAPGRYDFTLIGRLNNGEQFSLSIPLEVAEP